MSQETIELAHRAYDAFNRRDIDALLALCDPEVEFVSYLIPDPPIGVLGGVKSGGGGSVGGARVVRERGRGRRRSVAFGWKRFEVLAGSGADRRVGGDRSARRR